MPSRKLRVLIALSFGGSAAACDCTPVLKSHGATTVTITSPMAMMAFSNTQSFMFTATATNPLGLATLTLEGGGANGVATKQLVAPCKAGTNDAMITCSFNFVIASNASLIKDGEINLIAVAVDLHGVQTSASEFIKVSPIVCNFTAPPITAGTNPPVANVSGTSAMTVSVMSAITIKQVAVTYDSHNTLLQNWPNNPSPPFSVMETWDTAVGGGMHLLTVECQDTDGNEDTNTLTINVACMTNADCASQPDTACCPMDGLCHATVGVGDDCDCQHPCSNADACVTGTCGATPAQCRPGCFPGSFTLNEPAQDCPDQNGVPTYCEVLPADLSTVQNQGGACAIGDACDVISQNCPQQPIDRTMPPGANNPPVLQTCTPAAPTTNVCYPAGTVPLWATGCNVTCGLAMEPNVSTDCVQGALCVTQENDQGMPIGPSECRQQCTNPSTSAITNPGCPTGRPYCEATLAAGGVQFNTGVCAEAPCLTDSDCGGFPSTPCCNSLTICTTYASGSSGACAQP